MKARNELKREQDMESIGGIVGGGAGMVKLCGVLCGGRGKREGRAKVWEE